MKLRTAVLAIAATTYGGTVQAGHAGPEPSLPGAEVSNAVTAQKDATAALPCVAELCLGDGLEKLSAIKWEPVIWQVSGDVTSDPRVVVLSESVLANLRQRFTGDLTASAPYLSSLEFDATGLMSLAAVTGACTNERLYGRYTSTHGNPTQVAVALVQKTPVDFREDWIVVEITREMSRANSQGEVAAVQREVASRYARWSAPMLDGRKPKRASLDQYVVGHPYFTLTLDTSSHTQTLAACNARDHTEVD